MVPHLRPADQVEEQHTADRVAQQDGGVRLDALVVRLAEGAQHLAAEHPREDVGGTLEVHEHLRVFGIVRAGFLRLGFGDVLRFGLVEQELAQAQARIGRQLS